MKDEGLENEFLQSNAMNNVRGFRDEFQPFINQIFNPSSPKGCCNNPNSFRSGAQKGAAKELKLLKVP